MKNDKLGGTGSSNDLKDNSEDFSKRFSRGLELLQESKVDEARQVFEAIIGDDPEYAPAYFGLGCIDLRLDDEDSALRNLGRAIEIEPGYGESHLIIARILYERGDTVRGYSHVNKALQYGVTPDSSNELINTLLTLDIDENKLRTEHAVPTSKRFISYPHDPPFRLSLKKIGFFLNNYRTVIQYFIDNKRVFSIFIVALLARLFVFSIMPIDWNWDSYHHWQIAYYSLHLGFRQFRMWDLRGMEYFWGIFPHLVEAAILWVLNSSSILPYRIVNVFLGAISSVFVYKIGEDRFGWKIGFFSGILVAISSPYTVFDITALGDGMATFCVLASIYYTHRRPSLAGILLALGCQSRIEFWGIAVLYYFFTYLYRRYRIQERRIDYFFPNFISWFLVMFVFFIFFYVKTGNPVYPFYWSIYNVLGGYTGSYAGSSFKYLLLQKILNMISPTSDVFYLRLMFILLGFLSLCLYIKSIRKHNYIKDIDFYIMLFSIIVFRSVFFVAGGVRWITNSFVMLLMIRIFQVDIALILLTILYHVSKISHYSKKFVTLLFIITLPISVMYTGEYVQFQEIQKYSFDAADKLVTLYDGGTIICDKPIMVYQLVHKGKVKLTNVLSSHYSAFYYYSDPTIQQFLTFFIDNNVTLLVYDKGAKSSLYSYAERYIPDLFYLVGVFGSLTFLKVNQTTIKRFAF